ncbi:MAG: hypothetical protein HYS13_06550 [Planctomycetia bacterium]|nr:hypothetical protein [Planctomycetia bacterium]
MAADGAVAGTGFGGEAAATGFGAETVGGGFGVGAGASGFVAAPAGAFGGALAGRALDGESATPGTIISVPQT